jgi:hypothetical protein
MTRRQIQPGAVVKTVDPGWQGERGWQGFQSPGMGLPPSMNASTSPLMTVESIVNEGGVEYAHVVWLDSQQAPHQSKFWVDELTLVRDAPEPPVQRISRYGRPWVI